MPRRNEVVKPKSSIDSFLEFLDRKEDHSVKQIRDVPRPQDWITSSYYMGGDADLVYDFWKDKFVEFFESGKNELIITGGLGIGKTFVADWIAGYALTVLSCYDIPPLLFNMAPTTSLMFVYLSITLDQAEETGFGHIRRFVDQSPYFQMNWPRNPNLNKKIVFPHEYAKVIAGSNVGHYIGKALYFMIFDEANFVKAGGGEVGKVKKATEIYREAANRKASRFVIDNKEKGMRILISSNDSRTSFVEQRIDELRNDPSTMIVSAKVFDVKPNDYSKKRFWTFIGNNSLGPFVLDPDSKEKFHNLMLSYDVPQPEKYLDNLEIPQQLEDIFVSTPDNFLKQFKMDTANSLKEVNGVSIIKTGKLFTDVSKFLACVSDKGLQHPFQNSEIQVSTSDTTNKLIIGLKPGFMGEKSMSYCLCIDLSYSECNTGIAMGHIDHSGKVVVDLMLRVTPPNRPDQINLEVIQGFILHLIRERKFKISLVGVDFCQSIQMAQNIRTLGITVQNFSVDTSDEPYLFMVNRILAGRIQYYYYEPFKEELFKLIQAGGKVDKPGEDDFKDVSDAVCRVVNLLCLHNPSSVLTCQENPIMALARAHAKLKSIEDPEIAEIMKNPERTKEKLLILRSAENRQSLIKKEMEWFERPYKPVKIKK